MKRHLKVKKLSGNRLAVGYDPNHPKRAQIEDWLKRLSPGYVEFLLQNNGEDPFCNDCGSKTCEMAGEGFDDACAAFKIGVRW